jgi:hypothetical protein
MKVEYRKLITCESLTKSNRITSIGCVVQLRIDAISPPVQHPAVNEAPNSSGAYEVGAAAGSMLGNALGGGGSPPKKPPLVASGSEDEDNLLPDKWSRNPKTIQDWMALEAARAGQGTKIIDNLGDPKFKGMEKWELKVKSADGRDSVVHYVRDPKTGEIMDLKFKKHSNDVPSKSERCDK